MAEDSDLAKLPQATVVPGKRFRVSIVWAIPILAAVVAIGIAVQRILSEGPTVTVVFRSAEGVEAGKTFVKYKDVNIGQVTAVQLSEDYSQVEVKAKIAKHAAGLMVEDARFWVVKPRIALTGISGLGTLLSGNYIGFAAGKSDHPRRSFTGLEVPPIVTGGVPGRQFLLHADTLGSVGIGSPIYYRRLPVGEVVAYDLAADGKTVDIKIFVHSPYDKHVNPGTRFWNASGIDVSLNANGFDVRTESLAALVAGGLAFDTPVFAPTAGPAAADTAFTLYGTRAVAMKQPETVARHYALFFKETVRGLSIGAPVTLFGMPVGEVTDVGLTFDPATLDIHPRVEFTFYPERMVMRLSGKQEVAAQALAAGSEQKRYVVLRRLVEERGLRAQLKTGSLITGQLYVAFDFYPSAPRAKIDWSQDTPVLPSVESLVPDLEAKLPEIVDKINKLPLQAIAEDLKKNLETLDQTLKSANKLVSHVDTDVVPELKGTLEEARRAMAAAERVMKGAESTLVGPNAPTQQELRDTLQEVSRTARSLRVLTDYLERHPDSLIRGKPEQKFGRQ